MIPSKYGIHNKEGFFDDENIKNNLRGRLEKQYKDVKHGYNARKKFMKEITFCYIIKCSLFGFSLTIVQLRKTPGRVDSGTNFK